MDTHSLGAAVHPNTRGACVAAAATASKEA
jgi:hypothetical protein